VCVCVCVSRRVMRRSRQIKRIRTHYQRTALQAPPAILHRLHPRHRRPVISFKSNKLYKFLKLQRLGTN